ncbi:hypothetical protein NIASO_05710 [Niabella soli DSM 19437]|uniref:NADP oxidoreductase n=1 Tax=Niabella soli DSM 19437 TaxID=929713 RepID=W0EVH9_9BACT|nr:hypothetical protein NIASO_05710 [Niabella soli DSM 19437]
MVIVGTGNVATVLGKKLVAAGHEIVQVYGRDTTAASKLAYEWGTKSINYTSLITRDADLYLIAVADAAIPVIAADLQLKDKVVAHTAAAVPMEALEKVSENYGVFYPLQSIRKEQVVFPELTIYTEAVNVYTRNVLDHLAQSITDLPVHHADIALRSKLHVAAVFVNNFTNYLFDLAETFCEKEGIGFDELLPLIRNTVDRLTTDRPRNMQTGPAIRKDLETIARHKALLNNYPEQLAVYDFLSNALMHH